ncbi:hypothetical protein KFE98_17710 [bacterium SCSIO 12741]|nr:hypothetical protein KFE98_17710 [bacterium SCSIO 12741]
MSKRSFLLTLFILILSFFAPIILFSQNMSINANGQSPDPSAMLDITATDKGILIPRTDTTVVNAAHTAVAKGLLIYQISDETFYFYNGSKWMGISGNANDQQKVDQFQLTGSNLTVSLENDNEAPKSVDLSSLNTDNQKIDAFALSGSNLQLSLEDDAEATKSVDLSSLNSDNQKIDVLSLSGTNLQLSLEDDGESTKSVNLSSLQNISQIRDTDGDTRIYTEKSTDEDVIRFQAGGTEYLNLSNGRLQTSNTGGSVFLGEGAGALDDLGNNRNVFIGHTAGAINTSGGTNVAIGFEALRSNISGSLNIALGREAGETNNGGNNIFMGFRSGQLNTSGGQNIFIGYQAGQQNANGSRNIFIGSLAGRSVGGSNMLFIESSTSASNPPLIYGEFDNDILTINGNLHATGKFGVGTTSPTTELDVNGTVRIRGGSPTAGAVLVASDANGNATWSNPLPDVGYTQTTGTTGYTNADNFQQVTNQVSVVVESGDFVKIEGQVTARLTTGSNDDEWGLKAVRTGSCGSSDENLIEFTPSEDNDNDHSNFRVYNYLDYYVAGCSGTINFSLQMRNTGDDAWEVRDRTLIVTVVRQ